MIKTNIDLNNKNHKKNFLNGFPYEHLVFDDFFPHEIIEELFEYTKNIKKWNDIHVFQNKPHIKNRLVADYSELQGIIKETIDFFYSEPMFDFISNLLGVKVFNDPNSLRGGGLQKSTDGAFMDIHLDNNWNENLQAWTVANVILYLSSDWDDSYGGHLELCKKNKVCKKIKPILNRCVICINNNKSYHGYKNPIKAPENKFRQSLILFYFSKNPIIKANKRFGAKWKNLI